MNIFLFCFKNIKKKKKWKNREIINSLFLPPSWAPQASSLPSWAPQVSFPPSWAPQASSCHSSYCYSSFYYSFPWVWEYHYSLSFHSSLCPWRQAWRQAWQQALFLLLKRQEEETYPSKEQQEYHSSQQQHN